VTKTTRRAIALGVLVVVAGAAVAFAVSGSDVTAVELADVIREDLGISVIASGEVEADRQTDVYPPTAGTIASVEVTEGARVEAGQVLAVMDTAPLEIQVAQAEAAYQGAMAQRDAVDKSTPGPSDLKAAEAAVDAAYSAYQAADAAYEAAVAGVGSSTSSELATAELMLAVAQTAADAAHIAYDQYYENVYLPAPEPRDAAMESTLAALAEACDEADSALADAQAAVTAIESDERARQASPLRKWRSTRRTPPISVLSRSATRSYADRTRAAHKNRQTLLWRLLRLPSSTPMTHSRGRRSWRQPTASSCSLSRRQHH